jgi:hypothetical protein
MLQELQNPYQSSNAETGLAPSRSQQPAMLTPRAVTLVTMILAAAATRVIPHPWNFTAVGAMCLFGGAYFRRPWAAFLVPMAALLLSDIVLALTLYGFRGFSVISMSYLLFALTTLLGMTLRGRVTFFRVTATAILASAGFFLISNFHVWLTGHGAPSTLVATYIAAIPFAQNMFVANLFYSGILFGGYELLTQQWPALRQPATVKVAAHG